MPLSDYPDEVAAAEARLNEAYSAAGKALRATNYALSLVFPVVRDGHDFYDMAGRMYHAVNDKAKRQYDETIKALTYDEDVEGLRLAREKRQRLTGRSR